MAMASSTSAYAVAILLMLTVAGAAGASDSVAGPSPSPSKHHGHRGHHVRHHGCPTSNHRKLKPPKNPVYPSVTTLCNSTTYPALCAQTLASYPDSAAALQDLTAYVAEAAMNCMNQTYELGLNLTSKTPADVASPDKDEAILQDCVELLDDGVDQVRGSIGRLHVINASAPADSNFKSLVMDVRVWLSAAYTDQDTCWDEFDNNGQEPGDDSAANGVIQTLSVAQTPSSAPSIKDLMRSQGRDIGPLLAIALSFAQTLESSGPSSFYSLCP